jgi:hypothetical protein
MARGNVERKRFFFEKREPKNVSAAVADCPAAAAQKFLLILFNEKRFFSS